MAIEIKYNPKEDEKKEQEKWFNSDIYYWDKSQSQNLDFVIDTPPPTVSGYLHMGHVFSYCQTDFVARYHRMCGKNVFYPIGFDDNGLPTERLVEKIHQVKGAWLNKQGRKQEFVDMCYSVVNDAEKEFEKLFKTLGISYDWRQKYQTISKSTQDLVVDTFNKLKKAGLAYQKEGPVYWDVVDQTALAQSIIEDKEIDGAEHYLIWDVFDEDGNKIDGEKGQAVIMTTRPELLPACVAVFYNPDDERFKYLEGKYMQFSNITEKVPCLPDEAVRIDKGTGLVMCCTYGDWQDVEWTRKYNLSHKIIVDKEGKFRDTDTNFICVNGKSIEYTVLNPSGNITALVLTQDIGKSDYTHIAKEILQKNKQVEQVGFLTKFVTKDGNTIWKINMSGDEFCGNATRAFASYIYNSKFVDKDVFEVMCSGCNDIITATVGKTSKNDNNFDVNNSFIELPINKEISIFFEKQSISFEENDIEVFVVKLSGITHILIDKKYQSVLLSKNNDKDNCVKNIISSVNLDEEKAVGVIFYNEENNQIDPFVWVKDVDTVYNENACGSGSLAYGIKVAVINNNINNILVKQRNNQIINVCIDVDANGKNIKSATIGGKTVLEKNKNAIEARKRIIEKIQAETPEKIKEIKKIKHVVKIGERSKEPVEIIDSTQWYVNTLQFKEDLLVLAKYINFHPAHLKNRLIQWIEGLNQDWCISRDRFFGIEIPDNGDLQQVFDTWFTSSSSPFICRENERLKENNNSKFDNSRFKTTTALRPQAHEIIRTWTFSTMLKTYLMALIDGDLLDSRNKNNDRITDWLEKDLGVSFITEKLIPWKDVMLSGWCLAKDGAKMSKSAGNVITPTSLIEEKGSDIVRYWSGSCSLGVDTAFNETKFLDGKKLMNKLINATKFATMHFERQNLQSKSLSDCVKNINKTADRWIISRLRDVVLLYQKNFNNFEYSVAKNVVERLFWDEYCDNYLELVKVRAYADDLSALSTLRVLMEAFLLLFAPFMPHLCGNLYSTIFGKEANRQGSFEVLFNEDNINLFDDKQAENDMKIGLEIINFVRQKKAELNISIKVQIAKLVVKEIPKSIETDIKNMLNINLIEIGDDFEMLI